jgi:nitroreductase/NAD-dependent dihydropyrimidine dehydrogenase PreA subunit
MITINESKCIKCEKCSDTCVMNVIQKENENFELNNSNCIECGQCLAICPKQAIELIGYDNNEVIQYDVNNFSIDEDSLLNFIKFRRSIRKYKNKKVQKYKIEKLLEAGRFSPTGCNFQDVEYIIIDKEIENVKAKIWDSLYIYAKKNNDEDLIKRYTSYKNKVEKKDTLFYGGQQVIVVLAERIINGGIAVSNIELMAYAMGLGTLYCGFAERGILEDTELKKYFGIDEKKQLVACLVIGYPDIKYLRTVPRKKVKVEWR